MVDYGDLGKSARGFLLSTLRQVEGTLVNSREFSGVTTIGFKATSIDFTVSMLPSLASHHPLWEPYIVESANRRSASRRKHIKSPRPFAYNAGNMEDKADAVFP